MPRYIITSTTTGNEVDVTYDDCGQLVAVTMTGQRDRDQHIKAWNILPLFHDDMVRMVNQYKTLTIREVPPSLDFDTFWKAYDHKFDRKRAEAIWKRMMDSDRLTAINAIKDYDRYLGRTGIAKAYAKTWLANESYNNDYKRMK